MRDNVFIRLSRSPFRSRFKLNDADKKYIKDKGIETIRRHAEDFISKRIAPAVIINDGKQTPMHGHPVFKAQHAMACCCRGCIQKWHNIPAGRELTRAEQKYIADLIIFWLEIHK